MNVPRLFAFLAHMGPDELSFYIGKEEGAFAWNTPGARYKSAKLKQSSPKCEPNIGEFNSIMHE